MRTRVDETNTVTCAVTCAMTSTVTCAVTCSNRLGPGVWGCVLAKCLPPVPVLEALYLTALTEAIIRPLGSPYLTALTD